MKRLSQKQIDAKPSGEIIGSEIIFFPELTSTFDKIRELEIRDGLTVVCSRQTAGCGRMGRRWESNPGGVYFTFALLPPFGGFDVPFLTIVCALGVCKALSEYIPCNVKWPNDIVSDGRKLCGILTRNLSSGGKTEAVLVGIGINVNNCFHTEELPYASSLMTLTDREYDENEVLCRVLKTIDTVYTSMSKEEILQSYKSLCINLGREVTLASRDGDIKGICTDILSDGSMDVMTQNGSINVHSGEVSVKGIYQNNQEGNF